MNTIDRLIEKLNELKSLYMDDIFFRADVDNIRKDFADVKNSLDICLTDIDKYVMERTPNNTTINGRLMKLAEVLFDNAESSGQEGDFYAYNDLMDDYNLVLKYIKTNDDSLKNEVYNLYKRFFMEDIEKLPTVIALVGTTLENCLGTNIESELYYYYTLEVYKLLKEKVLEGNYEFIVDITSRTCVVIIVALMKLKTKCPNIRVTGVGTTNYLDINLPKTYRELYFKTVDKLDNVIFLDEVDNKSYTNWRLKEQLDNYLTSSEIKECLVFSEEVSKDLKRSARLNNCKVTLCNIDKPKNVPYYCSDCSEELKDGIEDTVYCEVCGKAMCIDCGTISKFVCNGCRR